mmetsp:Transcript_124277/g.397855  ORF Transcript_124277/g.397855 Transcript_124277/m.397855 type:complete len:523 (-) Transcript_124277:330-1898(-)
MLQLHLGNEALSSDQVHAAQGLHLDGRLDAAIHFLPEVCREVRDELRGDRFEQLDAFFPKHASDQGLDSGGGHVLVVTRLLRALHFLEIRLHSVEGVFELADALLHAKALLAHPGRCPHLQRERHDAPRLGVQGEVEHHLDWLLRHHNLVQFLLCAHDFDLSLDHHARGYELHAVLLLEPLALEEGPNSLLDEPHAVHVMVIPSLLSAQGADVHAVPVPSPDPLDIIGRLLHPSMPHPHGLALREPHPGAGLDLRHDLAQEGAVQDQRPEALAGEHATHPRLNLHGGAVSPVRRRHSQHEFLLTAHLLHAQPELSSQRLRAFLDSRLRNLIPVDPLRQDAPRDALDFDQALQVPVLLILLPSAKLDLLHGGLLRTGGTGEHGHALLHLGHHLDPRVEVVVDSHPRIVKPAVVGAAIVEELLAVLVEQLHPIGEIVSDVLLELCDLVLNRMEATVPDDTPLVLHDLTEEVVHRMPPNRLPCGTAVKVDATLLVLVLAPARRERSVEGLLGDPEHVGLLDGVDV